MTRVYKQLKPIEIKRLLTTPGRHYDGNGLHLYVVERTHKKTAEKIFTPSWIFRFSDPDGSKRKHDMGLGSGNSVSLAEARRLAEEKQDLLKKGVNPIIAREDKKFDLKEAAAKRVTFRDFAEAFIDDLAKHWRGPRHEEQWRRSLARYAYPTIGKVWIDRVNSDMVEAIVKPLWSEKPDTADRVRNRIENILDAAEAKGLRDGKNPARWKNHMQKILRVSLEDAKRTVRQRKRPGDDGHYAALPYAWVGAFMAKLRQEHSIVAWALEFQILTVKRPGEVTGAKWSEFKLAEKLWVIPEARMKKTNKEHRVPLSNAAMVVLGKLAPFRDGPGSYVFPSPRRPGEPFSAVTLMAYLRRFAAANNFGHVTVHGFRSAFRDWVGEETEIFPEVAELALAHTVGDKVEQAYRRGDGLKKRYACAEAWANYCNQMAPPPPTPEERDDNVVPIRRAG